MHPFKKPPLARKSQSTINTFFRKPSKPKEESLFVDDNLPRQSSSQPMTTRDTRPLTRTTNEPEIKPKTRNIAWWKTPPKTQAGIPGAKKRTSNVSEFPDFTTPAKKFNSLDIKSKPLARPQGKASIRKPSFIPVNTSNLSKEQKLVLDLCLKDNKSVFFTGAAGTGKSYLLRKLVHELKRKYTPDKVVVTGTTGLAAYNVGGQTIHRWSGIGVGNIPAIAMIKRIRRNNILKAKWDRCAVLVIDEVSMLHGHILDLLEEVARGIKNPTEPFGGIQVILTGDFYQLPPVSRDGNNANMCFEAKCWNTLFSSSVVLTQVFRQKDMLLVNMLNAMRMGEIDDEMDAKFFELSREVEYNDGLAPTELYPLRSQVDTANASRMRELKGKIFRFQAYDHSEIPQPKKVLDSMLAPELLELKVGAQVLLVRNLDDILVNGRRGTVLTFIESESWDILREFLLKYPEALELYNIAINLDHNANVNNAALEAQMGELVYPDDTVKHEYYKCCRYDMLKKLPVVDFKNGDIVLIETQTFSTGGEGERVSRDQLPIILSWAISIHKSQGQTLDRVIVDLSKVFESGQAYVAVSRATSYDRLQILGYNRNKVKVHPKVIEFYKSIQSS